MGGREVGGLANMLAAHMDIDNADHRALVQNFWRSPKIAAKPGLKAVDLFKAIHDGGVKAVWIIATNPVDSLPDADFVRAALEKCPFVVVSDVAENTDTGRCAHVLLPAEAWGEKDGAVTNSERRISRQRRLRKAAGEARADWRAICDVAKRMGFAQGFDYDGPAAIFREHAALSGADNNGTRDFDISAFAEISDAGYDALAPFQWPRPAGGSATSEQPHRFFADGAFFTATGRGHLIATPFRGLANPVDAEHPFILNTGRIRDQWHTMTRTGRAQNLSQHIAEPFAELNPMDAARLGVETAGLVRLANARGSVILRAQITDRQRRGSVFAPIHWTDEFASHARIDALVAPVVDPLSGQPESKATPVAVEAFDPAWYAFALTRQKPELACDYWARARINGGWRCELAGLTPAADWEIFARKILDVGAEADLIAMRDEKGGSFRCVAVKDGQIQGVFFVSPTPVAAARAWLCEQFGDHEAIPLGLLAGQPPNACRDPGRKICICMNVGANTILDAIREKTLTNAAAVAEATGAGTGCGSCKPEIERLLNQSAPAGS
jgi:assimilatory nitrate reductase catalytic subunit